MHLYPKVYYKVDPLGESQIRLGKGLGYFKGYCTFRGRSFDLTFKIGTKRHFMATGYQFFSLHIAIAEPHKSFYTKHNSYVINNERISEDMQMHFLK